MSDNMDLQPIKTKDYWGEHEVYEFRPSGIEGTKTNGLRGWNVQNARGESQHVSTQTLGWILPSMVGDAA